MLAGVSWILLWFLPETYAPAILAKENVLGSKCKEGQNASVAEASKNNDPDHKHTIKGILVRPIRLFFCEPIVFCVLCMLVSCSSLQYFLFIFRGIPNHFPRFVTLLDSLIYPVLLG
jgi:hypothetical protein